jgi:hypothetical protein
LEFRKIRENGPKQTPIQPKIVGIG